MRVLGVAQIHSALLALFSFLQIVRTEPSCNVISDIIGKMPSVEIRLHKCRLYGNQFEMHSGLLFTEIISLSSAFVVTISESVVGSVLVSLPKRD